METATVATRISDREVIRCSVTTADSDVHPADADSFTVPCSCCGECVWFVEEDTWAAAHRGSSLRRTGNAICAALSQCSAVAAAATTWVVWAGRINLSEGLTD